MIQESIPFTIESFYNFVGQEKLMGAECTKCGSTLVPPRPKCPQCFSQHLKWKQLQKKGKLVTYTVIHVSPKRFQALTPYVVGIIDLGDGARLPGIVKGLNLTEIEVGIDLQVGFEKEVTSDEWPRWPRYFFKPLAKPVEP